MKSFMRIMSLLMAVVMLSAMLVVPANAKVWQWNPRLRALTATGSIKLTSLVPGSSYALYRILDLYAMDDYGDNQHGTGSYLYMRRTDTTVWNGFIDAQIAKGVLKSTPAVGTTPELISWAYLQNSSVVTFSEEAHAYAIANNIVKDAAAENVQSAPYTFTNLVLGYYLISSSAGSKFTLTTTDQDVVEVQGKNQQPTLVKEVQENSTKTWGDTNDAEIGELVTFRSIITKVAGASNYKIHDIISEGLTLPSTVDAGTGAVSYQTVRVFIAGANDDISSPQYVPQYIPASSGKYMVSTDSNEPDCATNKCSFHVQITDSILNFVNDGDKIVVEYDLRVNEKAKIGAAVGNDNTAYLSFGQNDYTTWDSTKTYTWSIPIYKYRSGGNSATVAMEGVGFTLYDATGNAIALERVITEAVPTYIPLGSSSMPYTEIRTEGGATQGNLIIKGLDSGTYVLKETTTPPGFTPIDPMTITIDANGLINGATLATIEIENKATPILPETGGIGTTIFYVSGSILVVGAVLFLVAKRRMRFDAE